MDLILLYLKEVLWQQLFGRECCVNNYHFIMYVYEISTAASLIIKYIPHNALYKSLVRNISKIIIVAL